MNLSTNLTPTVTLESRIEQRQWLKAQIEALETERKEVDAAIEAELHARGVEELIVGDHKVAVIAIDGRTSIDKLKLLEAGVTTSQIAAATTVGKPYVRLDCRRIVKK